MESVLLADCEAQEVQSLAKGLGESFSIRSHISNWKRTGKVSEVKRYLKYFQVGFSYFLHRKQYDAVVGWQQFYTLIDSFFCSVFRVKKVNRLIALNYTYKPKAGKTGEIYRWFMQKCLNPVYMDYIHVLSDAYADRVSAEFGFPRERILVTCFGINDPLPEYSCMASPEGYMRDGYALAIGRSNRDYDFLIEAWKTIDYPLVIICDTYGKTVESSNITIYRNVAGAESYPWIANCGLMVIPTDDGTICSGDTVLLSAMASKRKILLTIPCTLADMYVEDGKTALLAPKDLNAFRETVSEALNDPQYADMGERARAVYLERFSREKMGQILSQMIEAESERNSND